MIQFYCPDIEANPVLPEGESTHCCRVLRHKEGDEIFITDGKGSRFICRVINPHPIHTQVEIIDREQVPPLRDFRVILAVAPTKNPDRMEWMAEKCVELGVDEIILLRCARSERKFLKTERLQKVMIAAMKQSLGVRLPTVVETTSFKSFVESTTAQSQKFFGYCSKEFPKKEFVKEFIPGKDVIVMIGPEGDFSPEEVSQSLMAGFIPVTFGEYRLRTETACIFTISAIDTITDLNS